MSTKVRKRNAYEYKSQDFYDIKTLEIVLQENFEDVVSRLSIKNKNTANQKSLAWKYFGTLYVDDDEKKTTRNSQK